MKKKIFSLLIALSLIVVLLILTGCSNKNEEKEELSIKEETENSENLENFDEAGKLYYSFLKDYISKNNSSPTIKFCDLDFNKTKELIIVSGVFACDVYTIENGKVEKAVEIEDCNNFQFYYSPSENRYYWGYETKKSQPTETYIIKTLKNIVKDNEMEKASYIVSSWPVDKSNLYENFCNCYLKEFEQNKEIDLSKTYELASGIVTDNVENLNSSSVSNINKQKLSEVVQIGDYVNYLETNNSWRVLTIASDGHVILIYNDVTEEVVLSRGGELKTIAESNSSLKYYTEFTSIASLIPNISLINDSYKKYYGKEIDIGSKLEGDLYNINKAYFLDYPGSEGLDTYLLYINNEGTIIMPPTGISAYYRPIVWLRQETLTSGKDVDGSWILTQ